MPFQVIFLPGILLPAQLRYGPLLRELGAEVEGVAKELEVYRGAEPPIGYAIGTEVEGISQAAQAAGFERFHLYGHSAGGACALAFAAMHPERLLSLALDEPANDFLEDPGSLGWEEIRALEQLAEPTRTQAFLRAQLKPGVEPPSPPSGPPPPWMATRPTGMMVFINAIERHRVDPEAFRNFSHPVYFSHGSLSHPRWQDMRDRLAGLFPDFTSELYEALHHLNTSHLAEPSRVATRLRELWARAEGGF